MFFYSCIFLFQRRNDNCSHFQCMTYMKFWTRSEPVLVNSVDLPNWGVLRWIRSLTLFTRKINSVEIKLDWDKTRSFQIKVGRDETRSVQIKVGRDSTQSRWNSVVPEKNRFQIKLSWILSLRPIFEKLSSFFHGQGYLSPFKISLVCIGIDWFEPNFHGGTHQSRREIWCPLQEQGPHGGHCYSIVTNL